MSEPRDLTRSHVFIDGKLVSAKVSRIVEAITDYDPEFEVQYVPQEAREPGQAAFAVIHRPPGLPDYVCFYVMTEEEFDERVLMKLIMNDQRKNPLKLSELEAWEKTQQLLQHQKFLDEIEEANDIAKHVFRTHLNKYTFIDPKSGRKITIRE